LREKGVEGAKTVQNKVPIAIVVDKEGITHGLVSSKDLSEGTVWAINDEYNYNTP
jgi:Mg2+/Co2+ transporter CorC